MRLVLGADQQPNVWNEKNCICHRYGSRRKCSHTFNSCLSIGVFSRKPQTHCFVELTTTGWILHWMWSNSFDPGEEMHDDDIRWLPGQMTLKKFAPPPTQERLGWMIPTCAADTVQKIGIRFRSTAIYGHGRTSNEIHVRNSSSKGKSCYKTLNQFEPRQ